MADEFMNRYAPELSRKGFDLLERLGRGSSGVVIKALQRSVSRLVAIKIHTELSGADAAMKKRFRRESAILGKLDHPSIPYVLTSGDVEDGAVKTPYHVMQFVDGESLASVLKTRVKLPFREAVAIVSPILDALAHAESAGIVHRDVAPDNVLIAKSGRIFLVDFSLGMSTRPGQPGLTRATEFGRQLGRAQYASPEQRRDAGSVTDRSDVFSVGVLFYELLSGTPEVRLADIDQSLPEIPVGVRRAMRAVFSENATSRPSASDFRATLELSRGTTGAHLEIPEGTAICPNDLCRSPERVRTSRGYVRSPSVFETTSDLHCASCGARLLRRCPGCHSSLPAELRQRFTIPKKGSAAEKLHCVNCGHLLCEVPVCGRCRSLLRDQELGRDTTLLGCAKCPSEPPPPEDAPF